MNRKGLPADGSFQTRQINHALNLMKQCQLAASPMGYAAEKDEMMASSANPVGKLVGYCAILVGVGVVLGFLLRSVL